MKCKICGKENDASMKFCGECGSSLTDNSETKDVQENENKYYSNDVENVSISETLSDTETKPKKKKTKISVAFIAVIAVFICVFAIFGDSKISGVSTDTYQECTRIMKIISTESYINETANEVENVLHQKYGNNWNSVAVGELHDYVLENSDVLNLFFNDIKNIPMTTENDKILVKFVLGQYAFVIEEALKRGMEAEASAFSFSAFLIANEYGYDYSYEECNDIYGTFILKYKSIYNSANNIEDIKSEIDEMSIFVECTALI